MLVLLPGFSLHHSLRLYLRVIVPAYRCRGVRLWLFTSCHTRIDFGFYGGSRASLGRRSPSAGDGKARPPLTGRTRVFMVAVLVVETDKVQSVIGDFYVSAGLKVLLMQDGEKEPYLKAIYPHCRFVG